MLIFPGFGEIPGARAKSGEELEKSEYGGMHYLPKERICMAVIRTGLQHSDSSVIISLLLRICESVSFVESSCRVAVRS
jgi:hypothetical protein